ncbi:MAG TPA: branched-chain amino acid ABC transporter permease [Mycobacteriales bacterium]|nr:branched-chain amino acid ABC transporter permease [Mycobacteriales bacterium]
MERFLQVVVDGIADGSVYAALALALVLIFRSTGVVNFAQGEMAMFATFLAWALADAGLPIGVALAGALVLAFLGGMLVERVLIRPVEGGNPLNLVIVTLGLFIVVNAAAGWIWGFDLRDFPRLFPGGVASIGGVSLSIESLGIIAVLLVVVGLLWVLFTHTPVGLAMRAAAQDPASARLVGVPVGRMLMLGWGLASLLGAVAGVLVAHRLFLDTNLMAGVLVYSFAGAALGGFDSPVGAVVGSWIIGVTEALAGTYVDAIGSDLKVLVPLAVIFVVLLVRPSGLFGSPEVSRA